MYLCDGKLEMYSGEDGLVVPLLSIGGLGVISVIANIAPRQTHDMVMSFLEGDLGKGPSDAAVVPSAGGRSVFRGQPYPGQEALNLMGMQAGSLRSPLCEMSEENAKKLEQAHEGFRTAVRDHQETGEKQIMIRAIMHGCNGHMGQTITGLCADDEADRDCGGRGPL